ncbi:hypothetical protein GEV33_012202 [Tenebrio molitor]|uniref:3'-5' exonuclease domain-containing protein n=1 Tax=Tenebrio molitor TaxID=7067 RepID=A0A8J6L8C0_TENMO|nr:hypothetical protein GEV33_012202 [Tenebrio molitor]
MHPVSKRRRSAKFLSSTFEPSFSPGECCKNACRCISCCTVFVITDSRAGCVRSSRSPWYRKASERGEIAPGWDTKCENDNQTEEPRIEETRHPSGHPEGLLFRHFPSTAVDRGVHLTVVTWHSSFENCCPVGITQIEDQSPSRPPPLAGISAAPLRNGGRVRHFRFSSELLRRISLLTVKVINKRKKTFRRFFDELRLHVGGESRQMRSRRDSSYVVNGLSRRSSQLGLAFSPLHDVDKYAVDESPTQETQTGKVRRASSSQPEKGLSAPSHNARFNTKIKRGDRVMLEIRSSEVFEGDVEYFSEKSVELYNIFCQATNTEYEGSMVFYRNEVVAISRISESTESDNSLPEKGGFPEELKKIKMHPDEFARLKQMTFDFVFVDTFGPRFKDAVEVLSNRESVAVVGLGSTFTRGKQLSLLMMADFKQVFIFDMFCLVDLKELKEILQSSFICKVVHDGSALFDCLYHKYKVEMKNVFDTQVT